LLFVKKKLAELTKKVNIHYLAPDLHTEMDPNFLSTTGSDNGWNWIGLDWIGLDWIGSDRIGSDRIGSVWI